MMPLRRRRRPSRRRPRPHRGVAAQNMSFTGIATELNRRRIKTSGRACTGNGTAKPSSGWSSGFRAGSSPTSIHFAAPVLNAPHHCTLGCDQNRPDFSRLRLGEMAKSDIVMSQTQKRPFFVGEPFKTVRRSKLYSLPVLLFAISMHDWQVTRFGSKVTYSRSACAPQTPGGTCETLSMSSALARAYAQ